MMRCPKCHKIIPDKPHTVWAVLERGTWHLEVVFADEDEAKQYIKDKTNLAIVEWAVNVPNNHLIA